jgi:hypothetical protein
MLNLVVLSALHSKNIKDDHTVTKKGLASLHATKKHYDAASVRIWLL